GRRQRDGVTTAHGPDEFWLGWVIHPSRIRLFVIIHLLFWVAYASADLGPSLRSISVGAMSACGGSIAAFLLWLFWLKKGKSVRISEHFLELRDAGWLTARFPWVDVSSVSTSS